MFLHISFPIADLRSFTNGERLARPEWPNPSGENSFIRSIGNVKHRKRGGLPGFASEDIYVDARKGVKFHTFELADRLEIPRRRVQMVFRRLYCTGGPVGHLDFGFTLDFPTARSNVSYSDVVMELLTTQVKIAGETTSMGKCGKCMAMQLLANSTPHGVQIDRKQMVSAPPVIVIEEKESESRGVISGEKDIKFGIVRWKYADASDSEISIWILNHEDFFSISSLRTLRLALIRLRAERETLRIVLQAAARDQLKFEARTVGGDRLTRYLIKADRMFKESVPEEIKNANLPTHYRDIVNLALYSDELLRPGTLSRLSSMFQDLRPSLLSKLQKWSDDDEKRNAFFDHANFFSHGHLEFVMTKHETKVGNVAHSVVTVGDSNDIQAQISHNESHEHIDALIKQLQEQANHAIKALPPDDAEIVKNHLENIIKEARKKEAPNRKWYEISAEGLKDAAKAVSDVMPIIVTTLKDLEQAVFGS